LYAELKRNAVLQFIGSPKFIKPNLAHSCILMRFLCIQEILTKFGKKHSEEQILIDYQKIGGRYIYIGLKD